jgi:Ni,Fe-hydrogenase maturation factor
LVRDEDTEAVSLLQSRIHEQAVEVLVVEKKTQQHLDAVSGMSARVKDETDKLLKQAKKLLGRVK